MSRSRIPKALSRQGRRPGTIPLWVLPDCGIHRRHVHGAGSPHPGGARRSDWRGQSLACLFPLQRFQGLPDRGRRPEYRRGRPVIQSASPRLARALFLVREWKRDHWPDSSRSRHCGRALISTAPPWSWPGELGSLWAGTHPKTDRHSPALSPRSGGGRGHRRFLGARKWVTPSTLSSPSQITHSVYVSWLISSPAWFDTSSR